MSASALASGPGWPPSWTVVVLAAALAGAAACAWRIRRAVHAVSPRPPDRSETDRTTADRGAADGSGADPGAAGRTGADRASARASPTLPGQPELQRGVQELMAELEALARQISDDIDARASRLRRLLADADRRIATLERLAPSAAALDADAPAAARADTAPSDGDNVAADPDRGAVRREVCALADVGLGAADIARLTGRPIGEVELILNLRVVSPGARPPGNA